MGQFTQDKLTHGKFIWGIFYPEALKKRASPAFPNQEGGRNSTAINTTSTERVIIDSELFKIMFGVCFTDFVNKYHANTKLFILVHNLNCYVTLLFIA